MFIKKIFDYFFGNPEYNIEQHWEKQSKKNGLRPVMFWCEDYNIMADKIEKEEIVKHLKSINGKKILDIGCGIGRLSSFLALKGSLVTGIDIPPMIKKARKENSHKNINYEAVSIFEYKFPSSWFDYVLSVATICLIADTDEKLRIIFNNISRTLRNGGLFLCIEPFHQYILRRPCHKSVQEIIDLAKDFKLKTIYKGGILNFVSRVTIESLKKINIPFLYQQLVIKKIFYIGEFLLKIPVLKDLFSDYKVIVFKKLK
jgi:SAM-dependent methyltransferase